MESAQTGQLGKSDPRGQGLGATVDMTSATAGIVTSLRSEPGPNPTLICLTMSQHKCVGFTLFLKIHISSSGVRFCDAANGDESLIQIKRDD
jgi:hypothetical protein